MPARTFLIYSAAVDELTKASHKIAEHIYKSAQGQPGSGPESDGGGSKAKSPEEEVVEAEFEDMDKNKNK